MTTRKTQSVAAATIPAVIQWLKSRPDTRAIFVGGSLGRGEADAWSDIDVLVVTSGTPRFIRYHTGRLDIEVETVTLASMKTKLRRDPTTWYAWQDLARVYDPERLLVRVKTLVRDFGRSYRTPGLKVADQYIRLRHWRQKCARGGRTFEQGTEILFNALLDLIRSEYALRHQIVPPTSHLMTSFLREPWAPQLRALTRRVLRGRGRPHILVPQIDAILPRLAPAMKPYKKYYQAWDEKNPNLA